MNLYELLGLQDFDTTTEIQRVVSKLPDHDRTPDIQLAVDVLTDHRQLQLYNALLRAVYGEGIFTLIDAKLRSEAMQLATRLDFVVSPGSHAHAFRVCRPSVPQVANGQPFSSEPNEDQSELAVKLGSVRLLAACCEFTVSRAAETTSVLLLGNGGTARVDEWLGDRGTNGTLVIIQLADKTLPACHISAFDATPLATASDRLFDRCSDIPAMYGIRAKRSRIQSLILSYYQWLAELAAKQGGLDQAQLAKSFLAFAKRTHPYFP